MISYRDTIIVSFFVALVGMAFGTVLTENLIWREQDLLLDGNHITCYEQCTLDITEITETQITVRMEGRNSGGQRFTRIFKGPATAALMECLRNRANADYPIGIVLDAEGLLLQVYETSHRHGYKTLWTAD